MTEKNDPVWEPCNCPICAIERVYLEAAARRLDAEILSLIGGSDGVDVD